MEIREKWQALMSRIDELELRQRGLLLLTVITVLFLLWDQTLMGPLDSRRQVLGKQVQRIQKEMDTLNASIQKLAGKRAVDPYAPMRERVQQLRSEITMLNQRLDGLTGELIPPTRMPEVLESLMTREADLELVRLEGLGAVPVIESVTSSESLPGPVPGLFRHGMRLVFRGSYLDTLALIEEIEGLPWKFIWSRVSINVDVYPEATVTLELYSLSLADAWLEV